MIYYYVTNVTEREVNKMKTLNLTNLDVGLLESVLMGYRDLNKATRRSIKGKSELEIHAKEIALSNMLWAEDMLKQLN